MTTVLIVDDRAVNRQFMTTLLSYFDYSVLESINGVEAFFMIQTERPDIVITDILMPGMDGIELVKRVRGEATLKATKFIFYSATYRLRDAREMADELGVQHVIGKPAEPSVILDTIAVALGEKPDGGAARRKRATAAKPVIEGVTRRFVQTLSNPEAMSIRLAAIIELCLDLTAERDPDRMIELFCGAARDLLGARQSAVAITDGRGGPTLRFVTRGYDPGEEALLREAAEQGQLLPSPPAGQNKIRHPRAGVTTAALGFPAAYPLPATLLAVSLAAGTRDIGWFYVVGKQTEEAFDDDDVRIAHTLGALAALMYENALTFEELSRQTVRLQRQIGERGSVPLVS
jgi:CheY-like chemotaxis protein